MGEGGKSINLQFVIGIAGKKEVAEDARQRAQKSERELKEASKKNYI